MDIRYESEREIKEVIEKELKVSIPNETWDSVYGTEHNPPLDQEDKQVLIDSLAGIGIDKVIEDDANPRSLIRSNIYAQRILPEVKQIRKELFGKKEPPFPHDLIAAGDWLETEAKNQPPPEGHALRWGYKLSREEWKKLTSEKWKKLQSERPGLYGMELAILGYSRGDGWAHYIIVSDGTSIRRLWVGVNTIAKKLGCQDYQATSYILTGLIPYIPPFYFKASGSLMGKAIYARAKVELIINEPISNKTLIQEYKKIRKKIWGKERSSRKITHRHEQLVYFYEEHIDSEDPDWQQGRLKWNNLFPNYEYDNRVTFRNAVMNALKYIFPEAEPKSFLS